VSAEKRKSHLTVIRGLIGIASVIMVFYHLASSQYIFQEELGHINTHLGLAFVIIFLTVLHSSVEKGSKWWPLWLLLFVLSIMSTGYVALNWKELDFYGGMRHTPFQLSIGAILILLTIIATWSQFGPILLIFASIFVLYAYFGYLIPGSFQTAPITLDPLISKMSINMEGIYGMLLSVSASKVFLFMVFAAWMSGTGATGFFEEIGKFIGRFFRSGASITAIITSGLVGSVTGQAAANVSITGSFTIPTMKTVGYSPEQAGGIEAAASSGGPIIPPVMGIAAFIMASITGVSYLTIIVVALLPAFLYIFSCAWYAVFQGSKMGVAYRSEKVDYRELMLRAPLFLIPLLTIIILFIQGRSANYVSAWACVLVLGMSYLRKETRLSLRDLLAAVIAGAKLGSQVAIMCATVGIIVQVITMTGLGLVLPHIISDFCGNNFFLLLVFTGIVSIVLGMGLPAATSYVLVAVVLAPMMIAIKVPMLTAHFFTFYFCNFSYITPPVALAAIFASKIANANYTKTAIEASKVGIAGFILPFMFVWNPALLLEFSEPAGTIVMKTAACILCLIGLQAGMVGFYITILGWFRRMLVLLSAALFLMSIYYGNNLIFLAGVALAAFSTFWQFMGQRTSLDG
jgi:TRAP transporter 4TM/12TM fusion protein